VNQTALDAEVGETHRCHWSMPLTSPI
jgi:hypothetical protein